MNTSYGVNAYRSHDLNIAMRTSSGDLITMDFSNKQSASLQYEQKQNSSKTSLSFSSQQSFKFSIKSNGISAQDQKEIDAFMKTAQPFIDKFLAELSTDAPKSPVTKLAKQIASIFEPNRSRSEAEKNAVKANIVTMFDKTLKEKPQQSSVTDKTFQDMQKLLEKTLKEFDILNKAIYA